RTKGYFDCQQQFGNQYRQYIPYLRKNQNVADAVKNIYKAIPDKQAEARVVNYLQREGKKAAKSKAEQHLKNTNTAPYLKPLQKTRRSRLQNITSANLSSISLLPLRSSSPIQQQQATSNQNDDMDVDDEIVYQQPVVPQLPNLPPHFLIVRQSSIDVLSTPVLGLVSPQQQLLTSPSASVISIVNNLATGATLPVPFLLSPLQQPSSSNQEPFSGTRNAEEQRLQHFVEAADVFEHDSLDGSFTDSANKFCSSSRDKTNTNFSSNGWSNSSAAATRGNRTRRRGQAARQSQQHTNDVNQHSVDISVDNASLTHADHPTRTTITGMMREAINRYNDFLDTGFRLYDRIARMLDEL
ncbi:unnamed protein product, partial [Didymodactylos carnosus]